MRQKLLFILSFLSISAAFAVVTGACTGSLPKPSYPTGTALPIVFVPGFKGSRLINAEGATGWLDAPQALGLSTPDLSLPLSWEDGVQKKDGWHPEGILSELTVLPWVLTEKIYGPWLDAAANWNQPFYPFAYDWRRDNLESVIELETFLESIRARHGGARVQVIAHSMGGLITLALLNRRPELFDRVVFVGVPFAGGIGFLVDMHEGLSVGLNHRILSPQVIFSFPSVYALFPLSDHPSNLVDPRGAPLAMDFYSEADWTRLKLGELSESRDFLRQALAHARRFRESLAPTQARAVVLPPVLVVSGNGMPTLEKAVQGGPASVRGWDFKTAPQPLGDGRVCEKHSYPPAGIPYEKLSTQAEHSQLLNDSEVQRKIRLFLQHAH